MTESRRRFMQVGFAVVGVACVVALIAMVVTGAEKVRMGHGLATFRTTWLVEFNWIAFLVLVAAIVVALVGGVFLRYLEWRETRQLQGRYGAEANGTRR